MTRLWPHHFITSATATPLNDGIASNRCLSGQRFKVSPIPASNRFGSAVLKRFTRERDETRPQLQMTTLRSVQDKPSETHSRGTTRERPMSTATADVKDTTSGTRVRT